MISRLFIVRSHAYAMHGNNQSCMGNKKGFSNHDFESIEVPIYKLRFIGYVWVVNSTYKAIWTGITIHKIIRNL